MTREKAELEEALSLPGNEGQPAEGGDLSSPAVRYSLGQRAPDLFAAGDSDEKRDLLAEDPSSR